MATLDVTYTSDNKLTIDQFDAKQVFKSLRTVFNNHEVNQGEEIKKHLLTLVKQKNKDLGAALFKAKFAIKGLEPAAEDNSGEHVMKIKIDGKDIAQNKVWINKPKTAKVTNIGLSTANTSEKAAAILRGGEVEGLVLKNGDGQHAKDLKWTLGGVSGSLPMTTHTKGDGGKNEKAALTLLKKTLNGAGYI
jgi:hypothetical protein